jgi:hypothetical protein
MARVILKGPVAGEWDFCAVCAMIYKGLVFKSDTVKNAVMEAQASKADAKFVELPVNGIKYHVDTSVTVAMTTLGFIGPVCWSHIAAHDEELYKQKQKEREEEALKQKYSA